MHEFTNIKEFFNELGIPFLDKDWQKEYVTETLEELYINLLLNLEYAIVRSKDGYIDDRKINPLTICILAKYGLVKKDEEIYSEDFLIPYEITSKGQIIYDELRKYIDWLEGRL